MNADARKPRPFPAEIVSDPSVMSGEPVVRGTRVPAATVLAYLRSGCGDEQILEDYPSLPPDGIAAVRAWAEAREVGGVAGEGGAGVPVVPPPLGPGVSPPLVRRGEADAARPAPVADGPATVDVGRAGLRRVLAGHDSAEGWTRAAAARHGVVVPARDAVDEFADAAARLADAEAELDEAEALMLALRAAGHLTPEERVLLHGAYLREARARRRVPPAA